MSAIEAVDTGWRAPAAPEGARCVTLAELMDNVAGEFGSLRLGPHGSYLRMQMRIGLLGLLGTVRMVSGGVSPTHGGRVFSLSYSPYRRKTGNWKTVIFTEPGAAERQLWVWTLADEERARQARIAARARRKELEQRLAG